MEANIEELPERYQSLSTDELLQIRIGSELIDEAKLILEEELSKRDINPDDYEHAIKAEFAHKIDIDSSKRRLSRGILKFVIFLILVAILGIYVEFFA